MIIKNGLIHSLEKGFYPDTIYIEETRFANLTSDEKILDASGCVDRNFLVKLNSCLFLSSK